MYTSEKNKYMLYFYRNVIPLFYRNNIKKIHFIPIHFSFFIQIGCSQKIEHTNTHSPLLTTFDKESNAIT